MDHHQYMNRAIKMAENAINKGQTPFGACIVLNDKILVEAHNQVWHEQDITAHAEIVAIRAACKSINAISLKGATLYSTCEPCPMCFSAIHWARIDTIVYGATISDAKKYGFNELEISNDDLKRYGRLTVNLIGGVERDSAIQLFETWKLKNPEKSY